ncbi:hypothetical protein QTP88_000651 [Uroleucon formosanum]
MSTRSGGSNCAIATCDLYSGKTKKIGMTDISFHRFPKDPDVQKIWTLKCKRGDSWNPSKSYICSKHFKSEDFIRDLKSELMGNKTVRRLKPGSIPTLNLPTCLSTETQCALKRRSRIEAKSIKESHNQLIATTLDTEQMVSALLFDEANNLANNNQHFNPNYEIMYNELFKEHQNLKNENEKLKIELLSFKPSSLNYKNINENLRHNIKILEKRLKTLNSVLTQTQKNMSNQIKSLTQNKTLAIENKAKSYLSAIFTPNQLNLLMKKKKQVNWTQDEISKAFTLRYFSKRAYMFVNRELHYPLPGLSSLQRWAKGICMRNGILHDVLKIMELNGNNLEDYQKLTVLMFDEVKVCSTLEYDTLQDEVVGPHDQMQVVMARGIASPWKQPVFVDFDRKMTKEILFSIINELDQIGFKVICCVSDCGGGNVGLWRTLDISYDQPVFCIPNGRNIVFIPDAPHILKLVRNWLLDTGFIKDDKLINKQPLEALVSITSTELSVCHKLSNEHLICEGSQRQKVKLATQLISHTTATALKHYEPISDKKLNSDTAEFIELINNWFDLANVSHPNDNSTPFKAPYGLFLEEQNALLDKVYDFIFNMRCINKSNLQLFQKALLMNINGTRKLLNIVQEHGLKYLLTSKSNQDAVENLFGQLRTGGGLNDHPSPLNALYRLRMIILGKNPGVVSTSSNTYDKNQEEFMVANTFKQINFKLTDNEKNEDTETGTDTDTDTDTINDNKSINEMTQDAIEYLAGWIAKKYRMKFPELGCTTTQLNTSRVNDHNYQLSTWTEHLSYGGLIVPSNYFKTKIFRIEKLFKKITKRQIPKGPRVVKQLTQKIFNRMDFDEKYYPVIQAYVKQRIFIRMKYTTKNQKTLIAKRKAKSQLLKLQKLQRIMT